MKPELIDAVALATSYRDRDELDRAMAHILYEHVRPERVRVYRVAGEEGSQRVQLRVLADAQGVRDSGAAADPADLPLLHERDHWRECALLADVVHYLPDGVGQERFDSVFPLMGTRGLTGLVEVEFSGARAALRPRDASLMHGVLRILRNHLSALDYGERDSLTGLLNRRTFETTFAKRRNALAVPCPVTAAAKGTWLAMIDVDRFKSINDNFGHLFGDEVLLLVSRLMCNTFRSTELLYRFGGEEFVVLIDGADEAGAALAAERLRQAVAAHRFPQIGQVTVSIGYTRVRADDNPVSAVERADAALYYAKEHGRNCSQCHDALLRTGAIAPKLAKAPEFELF